MKLMLLMFSALVIFPAASADILLEDDFSDGNADGWDECENGGCNYEVVEGEYWFHGPEYSWGLSCTGDSAGTMTVPDYSVVVRVVPDFCSLAGPVVRYSGIDSYFAGMVLMPENNFIYLFDLNLSVGNNIIDYCYFSIDPEESYWMRLEVEGSEFRGRAWTGEIGDEPTDWAVSGTDTLVNDTGAIGLYSQAVFESDRPLKTNSAYFDDVMVFTELAGAMEPMTWGGLKTRFPD